ncbi:hypothetical protein PILCRDRAFT_764847 [Piloderma croceum F 1598]|uniref:Major facilitator superfamily (MFS) profile domain-containing protein n=1 Tax=Piloderma croceum (strain F 1598) TaxID=765440 RepID=A0A0C3G3W7_PILCF|nr:hypothetical protein PILCRDRAFT_764847 [Piloderma croceum F 1598]
MFDRAFKPSIIGWGVVLTSTAACTTFTELVILRTLLGIVECVCQTAFVFLATVWHTRDEQALVIGSFYSMNGLQCVEEHAKLKSWQIAFTLLGCLTVVWGIFVSWWLPDSSSRAKCFSAEDRLLLAERVLEAFFDPTVWAVVLIPFTNALPGGLAVFSNILLKAFGFTQLQIFLLVIAQGAIIMSFLFTAVYLSKFYSQKLLFEFIFTLPSVAGTIVLMTVPTTHHNTKVGLLLAF